ncbi:MAG: nuclear transport factor 2 family protein [Leptolyngbyaceae cyanobacterium CSU_1_3]|nr:nuclear transport factor 2 family protein [Leptolyngbyaceae cyanobacterium CSU_1_3]
MRHVLLRSLLTSSLSFALASGGGLGHLAIAATPETAPPQLKEALTKIDAASNRKNVQEVLQFYSPNFSHSDGLTRQTLEQSLAQLWKQYPNINYRTELKSWQTDSRGLQAETVTYITGTQTVNGQPSKLTSTLQARQRFEGQKIVQQEILAERSQITSGENPPQVQISLPAQVRVGQEFSFDAIVQEPLGRDLLLGSVLEEPVKPTGYLNPTTIDLELLTSGGIFKVGRAPNTPNNHWISAVLVRHGGMTMVTQRLRVVGNTGNIRGSLK